MVAKRRQHPAVHVAHRRQKFIANFKTPSHGARLRLHNVEAEKLRESTARPACRVDDAFANSFVEGNFFFCDRHLFSF